MTFMEWWSEYRKTLSPDRWPVNLAGDAFEVGVQEGLRRAAEKETRKKPTGLIHNTDEQEGE